MNYADHISIAATVSSPLHESSSITPPSSPVIKGMRSASIMNVANLVNCNNSNTSTTRTSTLPQQAILTRPAELTSPTKATSTIVIPNCTLPFQLPPHAINLASLPYKSLNGRLRHHNLEKFGGKIEFHAMSCLHSHLYTESIHITTLFSSAPSTGKDTSGNPRLFKRDVGSVTHVLAIVPSTSPPSPFSPCVLLPIHALLYAMQCATLPALSPSQDPKASPDTMITIPIVRVPVPSPDTFVTVHRFLYTRSVTKLLKELLPLTYLGQHWKRPSVAARLLLMPSKHGSDARAAATTAGEIISTLPFKTIKAHIRLVSKAWCNGNSIGLWDPRFWNTLDRAYQVLINALLLRQRELDQAAYDIAKGKGLGRRGAYRPSR